MEIVFWDGVIDATLSEVWAPVPEFESSYMISSFGRVIRIAGGKGTCMPPGQSYYFKKPSPSTKGYPKVDLYKGGKRKTLAVHLLVLEVFVGPAPRDKFGWFEGHHINGVKADCRLSNLRWLSPKKNSEDQWHRYYTKGEVCY